jgi:hypothetical protein
VEEGRGKEIVEGREREGRESGRRKREWRNRGKQGGGGRRQDGGTYPIEFKHLDFFFEENLMARLFDQLPDAHAGLPEESGLEGYSRAIQPKHYLEMVEGGGRK